MDADDRDWVSSALSIHSASVHVPAATEARFIAPEIFGRCDVAVRQDRIAGLVSGQIIPRLVALHRDVLAASDDRGAHPCDEQITKLARLVLSPNTQAAANYVLALKHRGLSSDTLVIELLEPAARHLGDMWDRDECDFIDVTLGVGRLQKLLAVFNATHDIPAFDEKRTVLTLTMPGEQHGFGIAIVEKFLEAGGWQICSEPEAGANRIAHIVQNRWFAVAALTLSAPARIDTLTDAITAIRKNSCNPGIGIMVGGPIFNADPGLVETVGADATATTAPSAVIMAQKLFDRGIIAAGAHA